MHFIAPLKVTWSANPISSGAQRLRHVPLGDRTAGARSAGQGRPSAGACTLPLTEASTLAGWRRRGGRAASRCAVLLLASALAVCAGSTIAVAESEPVARLAAADPYAAHIIEASRRFGIPERWIRAVMAVESSGDPLAVSPKGAMGLMQIMPSTWRELRLRYSLADNPIDPHENILAGAAYLHEMHDRYGTIGGMLAAYNAGPARYDAHLATGRALSPETVDYIANILAVIDGTAPVMRTARSSPPPSWTRAPLFAGRLTVQNGADPADHDLPSGRRSNAPPIADFSALAPPSDGLFVRRPDAEGDGR
ncbi:lytic transglycosylase domain-containing protein [Pseudochelatococcus sp. B33]